MKKSFQFGFRIYEAELVDWKIVIWDDKMPREEAAVFETHSWEEWRERRLGGFVRRQGWEVENEVLDFAITLFLEASKDLAPNIDAEVEKLITSLQVKHETDFDLKNIPGLGVQNFPKDNSDNDMETIFTIQIEVPPYNGKLKFSLFEHVQVIMKLRRKVTAPEKLLFELMIIVNGTSWYNYIAETTVTKIFSS